MLKLLPRRQVGWRRLRTRPPLGLVDDMTSKSPREGGDAQDFGEIAKLHRPLLQRVALRLSGDPEVANDLVQETLLRGLGRFDQLQHHNAAAWLVTILTNLFYDYLKHRRVVTKAEPELMIPEAHELEGDSILCGIADADLYAAVQALEPALRDVVELCYLKEMGYREVAAVLKVPAGTIGTRLMRARARLRVLLEAPKLRVVKP